MDCGHKEITFICFEKKSLIKGQLPVYFTRQHFKVFKMFSELIKKYFGCAKILFTKIIVAIDNDYTCFYSLALCTKANQPPCSCCSDESTLAHATV